MYGYNAGCAMDQENVRIVMVMDNILVQDMMAALTHLINANLVMVVVDAKCAMVQEDTMKSNHIRYDNRIYSCPFENLL